MARQNKECLNARIEKEVVRGEGASHQALRAKIEKTQVRSKSYLLDLRIHSPSSLSCFNLDGIDTAPALVRLAKVKGLDAIAVTDYYSVDYLERVLHAAQGSNVVVISGVMIRCAAHGCDDIVLSCLFGEPGGCGRARELLRILEVPSQARGCCDYIISLSFKQVLDIIEALGGIAVPSRMDKTPSRKAVIKVLVEKYGFRAFDLAYYPESIQYFKENWPKLNFQFFNFSSATALAQVGNRCSRVKMPQPGFEGIKLVASRELAASVLEE